MSIKGTKFHDDLRAVIGGAKVENTQFSCDSLGAALSTYFECHVDKPEDDEETADEDNNYWGEWVYAKSDEAIEQILEAVTEEIDKLEREKERRWARVGSYLKRRNQRQEWASAGGRSPML